MIRHVVIWTFRPGKDEEAARFLRELKALDGVIPQIRHCEVGVKTGVEETDAILIVDFDSMEDLNAYKTDPRHVAVAALNDPIRIGRTAIDYEF